MVSSVARPMLTTHHGYTSSTGVRSDDQEVGTNSPMLVAEYAKAHPLLPTGLLRPRRLLDCYRPDGDFSWPFRAELPGLTRGVDRGYAGLRQGPHVGPIPYASGSSHSSNYLVYSGGEVPHGSSPRYFALMFQQPTASLWAINPHRLHL